MDGVEKIDLDHVDWKSSREFFESLGEALDKLDDKDESYNFTWVGKRKSIVEAGAPINKTLRPDVEASKNFDDTKNMLIVGDNLDALKLLQESYLGKIKMIYIDPPYNTGHDFVYHDNFTIKKEDFNDSTKDSDGNIIVSEDEYAENAKSNGRFHSDWLSMIYPRLKLAKNLLTDDGAIFISIDDNEQHNLRKVCDEVFGEENYISTISVVTGASQNGDGVIIQKNIEYIHVYAKNINSVVINKVDKAEENLRSLSDAPSAFITRKDMGYTLYYNPITKDIIPKVDYDKDKIETDDESQIYTDDMSLINNGYIAIRPGRKNGQLWRWRWGLDTAKERINDIVIQNNKPYFKQSGYNPPKNLWNYTVGTNALKALFDGSRPFEFSKNEEMLKYIISIGADKDSYILDFFAGSGTTGHAVLDLNSEDGGHRKFILAQINEETDDKSEAKKLGYNTIDQITADRIRRAGQKIDNQTDVGFRVLRIDSSNENDDIRKTLNKIGQSDLFGAIDNVKKDRTPLDLLFGVIYVSALPFDLKLETRKIGENTVYLYGYLDEGTGLVACFDDDIPEETIKEIAGLKALTAAFKDSSFANSSAKINLSEHFRMISPDTKVKVI